MASIVERRTSKGDRRLYVTFRATDRATGMTKKIWLLEPTGLVKEAKARKAEVETGLRRSGGIWPLTAPPTKAENAILKARGQEWLARHRPNLRDRVFDNYRASLEHHVYPVLGKRPMVELGPADVKELRDSMRAKGLADDTIRAALVPFRGIVRDWAEDAKRPDPVAGVRLFAKSDAGRGRRKIVPPEPAAVIAVAAEATIEARDAVLAAAATGLRRGELFGLRWRDIDFDSGEIHVNAYNLGGRVEDGRFKTEAGERDVPLFRSVRKILLERKARRRFSGPDDFVFGTSVGTALDPNNFVKRELKPAIARANAARAKRQLAPFPDFRWHDFRHYAISSLIAQKADILTIARIAGHRDPNVTLKVYGHLMRDGLAEAAELYDPLSPPSNTAPTTQEVVDQW